MDFDLYDYAGYIAPGAVLLFGLTWFCPWIRGQFGQQKVELAGIGGFLIASLVLGHLLHGLAHLTFEPVMRHYGLVSSTDRTLDENINMYVRISNEGNADRLELFNRVYGLQLGLSAALLVILLTYVCATIMARYGMLEDVDARSLRILEKTGAKLNWCGITSVLVALCLALGISLYRMSEFSGLYDRDLKATFEYIASKK